MKQIDLNEYCPCCGFDTFDKNDRGNYSICPICFWEDDPLQFNEPDMEGGANRVSLKTGQINFEEFGACEKEMIKNVKKPNKNDKRNPQWID